MNDRNRSLMGDVIMAIAVVATTLISAYVQDEDFRYDVNQSLSHINYRLRKARWDVWWRTLPSWRKEVYEQRHGPQGA